MKSSRTTWMVLIVAALSASALHGTEEQQQPPKLSPEQEKQLQQMQLQKLQWLKPIAEAGLKIFENNLAVLRTEQRRSQFFRIDKQHPIPEFKITLENRVKKLHDDIYGILAAEQEFLFEPEQKKMAALEKLKNAVKPHIPSTRVAIASPNDLILFLDVIIEQKLTTALSIKAVVNALPKDIRGDDIVFSEFVGLTEPLVKGIQTQITELEAALNSNTSLFINDTILGSLETREEKLLYAYLVEQYIVYLAPAIIMQLPGSKEALFHLFYALYKLIILKSPKQIETFAESAGLYKIVLGTISAIVQEKLQQEEARQPRSPSEPPVDVRLKTINTLISFLQDQLNLDEENARQKNDNVELKRVLKEKAIAITALFGGFEPLEPKEITKPKEITEPKPKEVGKQPQPEEIGKQPQPKEITGKQPKPEEVSKQPQPKEVPGKEKKAKHVIDQINDHFRAIDKNIAQFDKAKSRATKTPPATKKAQRAIEKQLQTQLESAAKHLTAIKQLVADNQTMLAAITDLKAFILAREELYKLRGGLVTQASPSPKTESDSLSKLALSLKSIATA